MGLAWQQGPLASKSVGRFLTPLQLPERLLFAEPLRRRMRVRFGDAWIADSEDVLLLHEPGHYPIALFPKMAVVDGALEAENPSDKPPRVGSDSVVHRTLRHGERTARRMGVHRTSALG